MPYTMDNLLKVGMPIAMAALVEAADQRDFVTYKDIRQRIESKLRSTIATEHIGAVVGKMTTKIHEKEANAPPLNVLCVNKKNRLPGVGAHGYIKHYNHNINYTALTEERKREVLLPVYEAVFNFPK